MIREYYVVYMRDLAHPVKYRVENWIEFLEQLKQDYMRYGPIEFFYRG